GVVVVFLEGKGACGVGQWLEFRRVLFRSSARITSFGAMICSRSTALRSSRQHPRAAQRRGAAADHGAKRRDPRGGPAAGAARRQSGRGSGRGGGGTAGEAACG